jgi:5-methylthioadenosine/S-adenosylhomocysteine deaminase
MIDGKWIMKDRKLMTVDEEKVVSRYNEIAAVFLNYLKGSGLLNEPV